ncbi:MULTISPECIES: FadR/GntR family transcriptional regulator [Thauera]|jgi:DNA-binding FadR family transcriptional regulator|uniref:GntR family transcriptional regulator n=1 Tax=Thauera humireducens TaxID=1134435 RepID=A0A127K7S9_9RHOO|nr:MULTISPECIES: FadR/GntR family transcriptional regulator [Thauera]AMO38007.1 GntR family transcriptional regulator [Thauera humireducens]ENO76036.1 GntR family transcriptional regulator [Thauera sp. 63]
MSPDPLPSASKPRRPARGLAHDVVADLTQRIQTGELRPGDKLPTESEIVRERGVSRTVVREAISRLQAAGLVETRHGIGSFVLAPARAPQGTLRIDPATLHTVRDIISILELRIALETEAASLAAVRRTDAQLDEMRAALDDFQDAVGNQGNCVGADIRFHLAIAKATGNPHFSDFMKHLGEAIIPRARVNTARLAGDDFAAYLYRVNREHEDIYNAIRRQDTEAARAAMRTHLSNSRERLVRVQEEAERPPA